MGNQSRAFVPHGKLGEWDGGLMMGIWGGLVRVGHYDYQLLSEVDNWPHFLGSYMRAPHTQSAADWIKRSDPTVESWPLFPGWAELTRLAEGMREEVGIMRWRHNGFVCFEPSGSGGSATLDTESFTTAAARLSLNAKCDGAEPCVRVSVLQAGALLPRYSGQCAALFEGDRVGEGDGGILHWCSSSALPAGALQLRLELSPGAQLFAVNFEV